MNFAALFRAVDAFVAFTDAARRVKGPSNQPPPPPPETSLSQQTSAPPPGLAGHLEARLTNVVVAALKEAFDRDHARLELERAHLEEERRRAEAALRLEMRRQAAERETSRLRMLAAAAMVGWLASVLLLGVRAGEASVAVRVALGAGWVLLLGALGAAFTAQGRVGAVAADEERTPESGAGTAALWLLVAGLAITAVSLLL